ncbi:MAG TPA: universal stress protein [Planctomycetaceae bacterium]|nr:universal stress protein [Planctomycetaceae bacterium]
MPAKKILFATDFSTASDAALEYAASLAREAGALLLIFHVGEPPELYGGPRYYGVVSPTDEELARMLEAMVPADKRLQCDRRLVRGIPADEIIRLAKAEHADLIVLGTHGRTGLRRILMGSVAEEVVRKSPVPVLTLREAEPRKQALGKRPAAAGQAFAGSKDDLELFSRT